MFCSVFSDTEIILRKIQKNIWQLILSSKLYFYQEYFFISLFSNVHTSILYRIILLSASSKSTNLLLFNLIFSFFLFSNSIHPGYHFPILPTSFRFYYCKVAIIISAIQNKNTLFIL